MSPDIQSQYIKRLLRGVYYRLALFGLDPRKTVRSFKGWPSYRRDLRILKRQAIGSRCSFPLTYHPCLGEDTEGSGQSSGHYFHQDLLVARQIYAKNPTRHIDIGSRIDGFVAHVASFRPITVFDIRPLTSNIPNVTFEQADLMAPLPDGYTGCCDSLSCLHALEHFGLGRYGDPVDHDGHLIGFNNITLVLERGGSMYLSIPIGPQRIEFNAHRVFSMTYLLDLLAGGFRIDRFSFVDDGGDLHEDVPMTESDVRANFGCIYGCGIFELTKL